MASGVKKESNGAVKNIIIGGIVALVLGGTAPWWWDRLFSGQKAVTPEECRADFYGLWFGAWTTEKAEILKAKYTIFQQDKKTVVLSKLQENPEKTYYAKCSADDDLIFTDGSTVVKLRVQGPDDLSGRVEDADGANRGVMEFHRSKVPQS